LSEIKNGFELKRVKKMKMINKKIAAIFILFLWIALAVYEPAYAHEYQDRYASPLNKSPEERYPAPFERNENGIQSSLPNSTDRLGANDLRNGELRATSMCPYCGAIPLVLDDNGRCSVCKAGPFLAAPIGDGCWLLIFLGTAYTGFIVLRLKRSTMLAKGWKKPPY
jgi:hypothetical protein